MGSTRQILRDGLVAGFIGYAVVVVFVSAADLVQGRSPFHTAAALGGALFYGVRDPAQLTVSPEPVLAYNGAHLIVFLILGTVMAWLATLAEQGPQFWYIALGLFLIIIPHAFGLPIWFSGAVRGTVSIWVVVLAASVAALAMGAWLWLTHPAIARQATDEDTG